MENMRELRIKEMKKEYGLLFAKDLDLFCKNYKETLDQDFENIDWDQVKFALNHLSHLADSLAKYGVAANDSFFSYCGFEFEINKKEQTNIRFR